MVKPSNMTTTRWKQIFGYLSDGETFEKASNDLTLKSGWTVVLYIEDPDSIASNDVAEPSA